MAYREAQEQPDRPLRCPACGAQMIRAPLDEVLYGCTGCGGCWTDSAAAKRVTTVLDERLLELAERAEKAFEDRPLPHDAGHRRCPQCEKVLETREVARTKIDVCNEHGTFFDRGELERVARVLEAERANAQSFTPLPAEWIAGAGATAGSAIIGLALLAHILLLR